jgi:dihydrofolate reductase
MRTVRYSVAASLDGYIAGPGGEYDWIPNDPTIDFAAMFRRVDTLLVGRVTWEASQSQGWGDMIASMRTIVFSRTLDPAAHPGTTIVRDDAAGAVRALKREEGKDIWLFGGGGLFASLLAEGLVDEVEVGLCPILLGGGIPLLPANGTRARLVLTDEQRHPSGILMLRYAVQG